MNELVRVAALTGYLETMDGFGIDPAPLLREQGITLSQLANPEQLLPARAAVRLLERSAQETGSMTFGLRMAELRSLSNLGATSLLIAHQPTLRGALSTLALFRARINSTLVLNIEEIDDIVILREEFSFRRPEPARQSTDLAVGVLARICNSVLGAGWHPQTVCFSHPALPVHEMPIFARLFGLRPQFDSEFNGIVLRASDLDRLNPAADVQLADYARKLLDSVLSADEFSASQNVDQTIRLLLPSGKANIQACAASLGMTVRTLQRALDADGNSFSGQLHRVRMQLAGDYLANPRMRITDVAEMLGYSSIGAFTRWHTHAFGQSPRDRRKTLISSGKC